jgi:hypothetical protein
VAPCLDTCVLLLAAASVVAAAFPGAAAAAPKTVWLCKPGIKKNPCEPGLSALLLGGNVLVKKGKRSGGDFKHIPRSATSSASHGARRRNRQAPANAGFPLTRKAGHRNGRLSRCGVPLRALGKTVKLWVRPPDPSGLI